VVAVGVTPHRDEGKEEEVVAEYIFPVKEYEPLELAKR
jgi:hypothetical protein